MSAVEPAAKRAVSPAAAPTALPVVGGHRLRRIALAVGAVFAVLFVVGVVPRLLLRQRLRTDADAVRTRPPIVTTVNPRRAPEVVEIPLPGSIEAILETGIWARTDGYLRRRFVDIGDHVVKGQQLADIETPEVDQQLMQAIATMNQDKATVVKTEADLALTRTTLQRYLTAGPGTVSKQQIDERTSAVTDAEKIVDAARATVNADEANVQRLLELQSFQKVYAPFDGVITTRNVDPGSLISAGSTSGTRELFRLAQVDVLRIFVYVPQSYAPDIKPGMTAEVTVRELPGRVFQGTVTRTAGAIDAASRTLLTEVQVPNRDGTLLSGSYATVKFKTERADPPLVVPQSALLIDAKGVRVALVEGDGTLHYRPIQIGRDFGNEVEVLSGIDATDALAVGLASNIADGAGVEIAKPVAATANPKPSPAK
ncbi:MAG: efflux RND transporter periplasmic adaptor subunit [Deltaproteobacteria bacterium]|nr:MAG: efflux RND transporter periplasmic adaptor subunit [Deltaproteobacteria bacterium]